MANMKNYATTRNRPVTIGGIRKPTFKRSSSLADKIACEAEAAARRRRFLIEHRYLILKQREREASL